MAALSPLPLLLLLAAAPAAAPARGRAPVATPPAGPAASPAPVWLGGRPLPLAVALEVRTAGGGGEVPLAWRSEADGAVVADGATPDLDATVELRPAPGGGRDLAVRLRWRREAGLERAAVRLAWSGEGAAAVGRDLAPAPLTAPLRISRGTPLLAWAGPALLAGGPGLAAARLEPLAAGPGSPVGAGLQATLYLDDAAERPFATYARCLPSLPRLDARDGHAYADLERKRPVVEAPRRPGDEDRLAATLTPLPPLPAGQAAAGPLVLQRWPAGARAAVVLTDHADRTEAAALRAVLWGHSDRRAEGGCGAGLLGRGLAITRSFFMAPGPGSLEDPETAALATGLRAAGSAVALHSITGGLDGRAAVRDGLAQAAPWGPATWIDHEPYVNCEALSAEGAAPGAPARIADLLYPGGIRWGWAAGDVAGFGKVEVADLFRAAPPGSPCPVIYPLPADPRVWVFQSSFFYAPPDRLASALSDEALERLEAGHGLFVGHTYLGAGPGQTRGAATARLAVRPAGRGALVVDPALDEAFARVARHAAAGRLASLTWEATGDRLRALAAVEVHHLADGGAEVANRSDEDLPGLTLAAARPGLAWTVDGAPAAGDADGRRLWFDLPAGARRVVRAWRGGEAVPLLPAPGSVP